MIVAPFRLTPLDAEHKRAVFNSDSEQLNRSLREEVTQDVRRRVAACFVTLADGLDRAAQKEIAAFALNVDAKNETTTDFYLHHGLIALPDSPLTLFVPLATV